MMTADNKASVQMLAELFEKKARQQYTFFRVENHERGYRAFYGRELIYAIGYVPSWNTVHIDLYPSAISQDLYSIYERWWRDNMKVFLITFQMCP